MFPKIKCIKIFSVFKTGFIPRNKTVFLRIFFMFVGATQLDFRGETDKVDFITNLHFKWGFSSERYLKIRDLKALPIIPFSYKNSENFKQSIFPIKYQTKKKWKIDFVCSLFKQSRGKALCTHSHNKKK
jgi:hypothetical protein